ncbi:hypothetical protein [Microbaculum marinum]|uniref:DUF306 domain-containing protein n=1 Tax=Microbaculum marinum TaxID=1764581 RepID=A0AAW9RVN4_9HYPH
MVNFNTAFSASTVMLAAAVTFSGAFVPDAAASEASLRHRQAFLGFWEGVDALDGSIVQSSISDVDNDGVIEVFQREGFFTICYNGTTNTQGRGIFIGTGSLVKKRVMKVDLERICVNDDATTEDPVPFTRKYVLRADGEVLQLKFTHELLLHRTSK